MSNTVFQYIETEGTWKCEDADCQKQIPNDDIGSIAIGLFRDGKLVHYKCAYCRGRLRQFREQNETRTKSLGN